MRNAEGGRCTGRMQHLDARLQRTIDALLASEREAHNAAVVAPKPASMRLRRNQHRRVRFGVKFVRFIPHRHDEDREAPLWTTLQPKAPSSPRPRPRRRPSAALEWLEDADTEVAVYQDSDEELDERIFVARLHQNLHVAAIYRMLNRGDSDESDGERDDERDGERDDERDDERDGERDGRATRDASDCFEVPAPASLTVEQKCGARRGADGPRSI